MPISSVAEKWSILTSDAPTSGETLPADVAAEGEKFHLLDLYAHGAGGAPPEPPQLVRAATFAFTLHDRASYSFTLDREEDETS